MCSSETSTAMSESFDVTSYENQIGKINLDYPTDIIFDLYRREGRKLEHFL